MVWANFPGPYTEGVAKLPPSNDPTSRLLKRVGATPLTQSTRETFVRLIESDGDTWYTPIALALQAAPTATVEPANEPDRFIVTLDRRDIDPDTEGGIVRVSQAVTIASPLRGRTLSLGDATCDCAWQRCPCALLAVALVPELQSV